MKWKDERRADGVSGWNRRGVGVQVEGVRGAKIEETTSL